MKPSHLQTPRTMNECVWTPGYTTAKPPRDPADRLVIWACLTAVIATVIIYIVFPEAR